MLTSNLTKTIAGGIAGLVVGIAGTAVYAANNPTVETHTRTVTRVVVPSACRDLADDASVFLSAFSDVSASVKAYTYGGDGDTDLYGTNLTNRSTADVIALKFAKHRDACVNGDTQ